MSGLRAARIGATRFGRSKSAPYVLLTLATLGWSSGWIIGRGFASEIPPMAMTFFRWLFAGLILAPFALRHVRRDWLTLAGRWKTMLLLGVLGVGTHNALAYLGLNYTTATNGVLLNSFSPVMIVALSWMVLGERLTLPQSAGFAISLVGMLLLLTHGRLDTLAEFRFNVGDVLILLAMALWSTYTICLRRRPPRLDNLSFLFVLICVGDAAILPLWLGEHALGHHVQWSPVTALALVSLALLSSVVPYLLWHEGVDRVGANVAGLFVHLIAVFGVLLAWLVLGEELHLYHLAGFALILAGIYVTSRFRKVPPLADAGELVDPPTGSPK